MFTNLTPTINENIILYSLSLMPLPNLASIGYSQIAEMGL